MPTPKTKITGPQIPLGAAKERILDVVDHTKMGKPGTLIDFVGKVAERNSRHSSRSASNFARSNERLEMAIRDHVGNRLVAHGSVFSVGEDLRDSKGALVSSFADMVSVGHIRGANPAQMAGKVDRAITRVLKTVSTLAR